MFLVLDAPGVAAPRRGHRLEIAFIAALMAGSVGVAFRAQKRGMSFVVLPPLLMAGLRT